jgi:hypothetical protein
LLAVVPVVVVATLRAVAVGAAAVVVLCFAFLRRLRQGLH